MTRMLGETVVEGLEFATSRAGNEPNQHDNSSELDSTINSLNLVHEPNELNYIYFDSVGS